MFKLFNHKKQKEFKHFTATVPEQLEALHAKGKVRIQYDSHRKIDTITFYWSPIDTDWLNDNIKKVVARPGDKNLEKLFYDVAGIYKYMVVVNYKDEYEPSSESVTGQVELTGTLTKEDVNNIHKPVINEVKPVEPLVYNAPPADVIAEVKQGIYNDLANSYEVTPGVDYHESELEVWNNYLSKFPNEQQEINSVLALYEALNHNPDVKVKNTLETLINDAIERWNNNHSAENDINTNVN